MSWKLYEEPREQPENDISNALNLEFSIFEPWEQRESDPAPKISEQKAVFNKDQLNDVDSMMLYIQAVQREGTEVLDDPYKVLPPGGVVNGGIASRNKSAKFVCPVGSCRKAFNQKTHLEIHHRSHTGERPFKCPHPGCEKSFSQRCNLKTHKRLHTGEKPFVCATCGKSFGQRGNLVQHKVIHQSKPPLVCKLDGCDKRFAQLGNLKSHHNNSHAETVRNLTARLRGGNFPEMNAEELEIFEYFTTLYKNSNRGIKGRGKGNKSIRPEPVVKTTTAAATGSAPYPPISFPRFPELPLPSGPSSQAPPHQVQPHQLQQQSQWPPGPGVNPFENKLPKLDVSELRGGEDHLPPFHLMQRWKP